MEYEYQKNQRYFAQAANSLEEMTAEEFLELGADDAKAIYRGISFTAHKSALYRILYESRLASRIIAPLFSFSCHSEKYLYQMAAKINWSDFITLDQAFAINTNVADSNIKHSLYASQVMKDAIVDQFREKTGERPNYNQKQPDVRFSLHIHRNFVNIGLDLSLTALHKRGYRVVGAVAPLQETLGAAIIRYSKWNGETPLVDPCCGSGTLLAEAMMHYCHIPAGYFRNFWGVTALPDYDEKLFKTVQSRAKEKIIPLPRGLISGSDISGMAADASRENLSRLPGGENVAITKTDFRYHKSIENSTIVTNLPFGVRLGSSAETVKLYNEFGDFLKHECKGSTAFVLVANKEIGGEIRLRTKRTRKMKNADLESILLKLELY